MISLLLVVFVNFVAIGALIPVIPYAVIDVAGGSETLMAWLMASFSLAMFVGAPILGSLSDRYGRKKILIGSILVSAVAHAVFAFSDNLTMMFISRITAGLAAGNFSVIQAIITDMTKPEDRARAMGMVMAFVGLGFVAGPAVGGLLSQFADQVHTAPFLLASGLTLIGAVLCITTVRETAISNPEEDDEPSLTERLRLLLASGLMGFALASFLLSFAFAQVEVSYVLVLKDLLDYTSVHTGWVFAFIGCLIVVIQIGLIGPVVERLTDIGTAVAGSVSLVAGNLLTALLVGVGFVFFAPPVAGVLFTSALICIGLAFTNTTIFSAASKRARQGRVGGSLGIVQGCGSLGQVGGLLLAGPLYQLGGGGLTFGAGTMIALALLVCLVAMVFAERGGKR